MKLDRNWSGLNCLGEVGQAASAAPACVHSGLAAGGYRDLEMDRRCPRRYAHTGNRTPVTSMGGLYDATTLCVQTRALLFWACFVITTALRVCLGLALLCYPLLGAWKLAFLLPFLFFVLLMRGPHPSYHPSTLSKFKHQ